LARYNRKSAVSSREIQTAVRLVLPGDLAKHGISEGLKAVTKYTSHFEIEDEKDKEDEEEKDKEDEEDEEEETDSAWDRLVDDARAADKSKDVQQNVQDGLKGAVSGKNYRSHLVPLGALLASIAAIYFFAPPARQ
jgi:hypothetical protein